MRTLIAASIVASTLPIAICSDVEPATLVIAESSESARYCSRSQGVPVLVRDA
jgi:hypothetical protein